MKSSKLLTYRILLLVAATMLLAHEVVPHHHHSQEYQESTCCSHGDNSKEIPCSVFDNVPLDVIKLRPVAISKEHVAAVLFYIIVPDNLTGLSSRFARPIGYFVDIVLKTPLEFTASFSHRGPPQL